MRCSRDAKRFWLVGFALLAGVVLCAGTVQASDPKLIATHGKWSAYSFTENGNKVCYMVSVPTKDEGNYSRRGQIYALITHRPAEGTRNVFSYIAGYTYKPGSDVTLRVDGQTFTLFTQDDTAWAPDAATDEKIAAALRKGSSLVVRGTSSRGTLTTDTFSLSGSGAAHDAITRECAPSAR
jgi:invasion protein IalB